MKKILIGIIVITLIVIAFFQFDKYQRFNPPVDYDYTINESVDVNYHNQALVEEYYSKVFEIGNFARSQWKSSKIDVRFPDQDNLAEVNAARYYNGLKSRVAFIEQKLLQSTQLKAEGYSNEEILQVENGFPLELVQAGVDKEALSNLQIGDNNRLVWLLQKKLIENGYQHQLDGLFGIDTQNQLINYQTDNNLFPSGSMNEEVFKMLFLN